jgi:hypothetical protein
MGCSQGARAAAILLICLLFIPCTATAQEVQLTGPLRAAPSLGPLLWRESRFAVSASSGFALSAGAPAEPLVAAEALYYPQDSVGVGAWAAAWGAPGPGWLQAVAAPEVVLVPITGRVPLPFDSTWLPFDARIDFGGAWRTNVGQRTGAPQPMVGVGLTTFFGPSWSCGLEVRSVGGVGGEQGRGMTAVAVSLTYLPGERNWHED